MACSLKIFFRPCPFDQQQRKYAELPDHHMCLLTEVETQNQHLYKISV